MKIVSKVVSKLKKCMSRDNNIVKAGACALIAFVLVLLALRLGLVIFSSLTVKEGYTGASELLLLHMTGCPHCVKLIPEWQSFVSQNNTGIKTRSVEHSEDPALVKKYGVTGFPAILLLDSQGKKVKTYKGPRTSSGLLSFCEKNSN